METLFLKKIFSYSKIHFSVSFSTEEHCFPSLTPPPHVKNNSRKTSKIKMKKKRNGLAGMRRRVPSLLLLLYFLGLFPIDSGLQLLYGWCLLYKCPSTGSRTTGGAFNHGCTRALRRGRGNDVSNYYVIVASVPGGRGGARTARRGRGYGNRLNARAADARRSGKKEDGVFWLCVHTGCPQGRL